MSSVEECAANSDVDRVCRQHLRASRRLHVVQPARRSAGRCDRNGTGRNARVDAAVCNSAKRRISGGHSRHRVDRSGYRRDRVDWRGCGQHCLTGYRRNDRCGIESRERDRNTILRGRYGRDGRQRRDRNARRRRARRHCQRRRNNGRDERVPFVGRRHELVVRSARADRRDRRSGTSERRRCADQRHQRGRGCPDAGVPRPECAAG